MDLIQTQQETRKKGIERKFGTSLIEVGEGIVNLVYEVRCKGYSLWPDEYVAIDRKTGIAKYVCSGCGEPHKVQLIRENRHWRIPTNQIRISPYAH